MLVPLVGAGALLAIFLMGGRSQAAVPPEPSVGNGSPPTPPPAEDVPEGVVVVPSAGSPEEEQAAQDAVDAAVRRDWQTAVAKAVESGDVQVILAVAADLRQAGKMAESEALELEAERLRAIAAEQGNDVTTEDVAKGETPAPKPSPDPKRAAAKEYANYMYGFWTEKGGPQRYKADRSKVAAFQRDIGRPDDGLFGPGDARTMVHYGIVPPDPFRWPSRDTAAAVASYKALMSDQAKLDPGRASLWNARAKTAGR